MKKSFVAAGARRAPLAALAPFAPLLVLASATACHRDAPAGASAAGEAGASAAAPAPSAPMSVTPIPADSVAKLVNPSNLPPYTGPTGSVEGTVRIDGPPSPDARPPARDFGTCDDARKLQAKLFREGAAGPDGARALADAIVVVTGYSGFYVPERNEAAHIGIKGCAFDARTVAMTFGQRLEVKSDAPDMWAPSLMQAPAAALMVTPPGSPNADPVRLYPNRPGYFTLVDRLKHGYARADVYALLQPLHAVTDPSGHYRIDGVPVGKVTIAADLGAIDTAASKEIEVRQGVVEQVDLVIHYAPKDAGPVTAVGAMSTHVDGGRPSEPVR
jgi:hypothetical protein